MRDDNRALWIVLAVLALVVLLGPMVGGGMMGSGMIGWSGGQGGSSAGGGGWQWGLGLGLGWLAMLAFWGAAIVGIILLVRAFGGPSAGGSDAARGGGRGDSDTALEVLRRRYAAGEISQEEYERMRQVLER